jgi:hypothetical protein
MDDNFGWIDVLVRVGFRAVANARDVLAACLDEAIRLATPSGRVAIDGENYVAAAQLQSVLLLAREAYLAGDGEVPDARVRESGLPPSKVATSA